MLDPKRVITLKCAVEYPCKDVIERIDRCEGEIFVDDSLWMYFDVKNGIRTEVVERLDGKRKEWMLAKMRSIGLNEGDKLVGLGERTIVSFMSEKTFFTSLSELVNKHGSWGRGVPADVRPSGVVLHGGPAPLHLTTA